MSGKKSILIVDDEVKITQVLESYFSHAGYDVFCANSGFSAMQLFEKHSPTLILLDLMLPDISGEDICRRIRQVSSVPIIMLTAKVEEESVLLGLNLGADDYITKPFSPRQIVAKAEAILRRIQPDSIPLSDIRSYHNNDLVIDCLRQEVKKNGVSINITPNEYNILLTLAKYPQKVFTRDELISIALSDEFEGFDRVIDTHIKNIRQKIEDDTKNPHYILTVHGVGYKFGGVPSI